MIPERTVAHSKWRAWLLAHLGLLRAVRRVRIPASAVLFILFLIEAQPTPASVLGGAALALPGLGLRAWASRHLRKDRALTTTGPYAYTRNPLYLGSFLLGLALVLACRSGWLLVWFLIFFAIVYVPTMILEAEHLRRLFGAAFETYEQQVPLFFPRPGRRFTATEGARGAWALYMANREYRVLVGYGVVLAILWAKAL
ncbi:MAG: isoprenylcysteine carboxylmethyltransferase family protein [Blastocatellia bacterium]|nr:isoprenylcysteine carboxylmethyltransferase family protein [Blastocatellia bacterium]MCS7156991.1 isoprenylcysteine carboxylmethyltransferase family protein [Blastocatellia bacterium]MCX7752192.1 isoprenylcysteine carboxylmethyltransferase family protein [Blastocatellia bacterium]MDW8167684.1 isoprenylcysteine carboxylmethyltransferase family protein [Acidobacteriota bacterium]MDW8256283.1 isoprenylcysteine carboxylmethyltransferase family protein [Acidobacteriota bacterium]